MSLDVHRAGRNYPQRRYADLPSRELAGWLWATKKQRIAPLPPPGLLQVCLRRMTSITSDPPSNRRAAPPPGVLMMYKAGMNL